MDVVVSDNAIPMIVPKNRCLVEDPGRADSPSSMYVKGPMFYRTGFEREEYSEEDLTRRPDIVAFLLAGNLHKLLRGDMQVYSN